MEGKMNITEELRSLLDERGVEWMPSVWSAKDETFYKVGEVGYLATEMSSGRMKVGIEGYLTSEQAVNVTLGLGTCKDVSGGDPCVFVCSCCGATFDHPEDEHVRYCPNCGREVVYE